ncbi:MAG: nickel-dependent lactate racemase [Deltaproteobacteria bacterium]|nr:nickel-dependent lactate racemase [Deltaproteobacteria bacterium]
MSEKYYHGHTVAFPWGGSILEFSLPESWTVLGELEPAVIPEPPDLFEACRKALSQPIATTRLADRNLSTAKVTIVVDDHTRPTPVAEFLPVILEELEKANCNDANISFLLANGVHRRTTPEEAKQKLGTRILDLYEWTCHDAYDPSNLVDFGRTSRGTPIKLNRRLVESDLVLLVGAVEPHLLLGYGGGLKMVIPGCAGADTIAANHLQGVEPDRFDFVGATAEDSPMRQDLEEGALLPGNKYFIINTVFNYNGRPTAFFCGHPLEAHRKAQELVQKISMVEIPQPADIVLANSFPGDSDLRQSIKCIGNSLYASKPGGVLLGTVFCKHGLGEIPIPRITLPYPFLRSLVKVIGKHRIIKLVQRIKRGEPEEEVFVTNFGLNMLRRNHIGLYSKHLDAGYGRKLGLAMVFNEIDSWLSWARKKAKQDATIWIFPHGGVSFARLSKPAIGSQNRSQP